LRNESAAWTLVQKTALDELNDYPSTISEDKDLLEQDKKENNLTLNVRNCIKYRLGEKLVFQYLIDVSQKVAELSLMNKKKAMKKLGSMPDIEHVRSYLSNQFIPLLPN
jgi:outer membrane protein assembly factor BamA